MENVCTAHTMENRVQISFWVAHTNDMSTQKQNAKRQPEAKKTYLRGVQWSFNHNRYTSIYIYWYFSKQTISLFPLASHHLVLYTKLLQIRRVPTTHCVHEVGRAFSRSAGKSSRKYPLDLYQASNIERTLCFHETEIAKKNEIYCWHIGKIVILKW